MPRKSLDTRLPDQGKKPRSPFELRPPGHRLEPRSTMEKVARKADSIFAQSDEQMLRALSLLESWTAKYRPGSRKASMSSRRVLVDGRMVSHRSLKSLRTIERGGI